MSGADRQVWLQLLDDAGAVAKRVRDHEPVAKDQRSALTFGVVAIRKHPLPLKFVTAAACAEAFLVLARAFVASDCAVLLARSVAACAEDLADLFEADRRARFEHSLKVTGGD